MRVSGLQGRHEQRGLREHFVLGGITLILLACLQSRGVTADELQSVTLLFTGSSSTYWNDMPREVGSVVDGMLCDAPRARVLPEIVGRSGSDIRVYLEPGFSKYEYGVKPSQSFLDKLRDERPKLVVLQVVCRFIMGDDDPTGTGQAHAEAVTKYCEAVRASGGEPIFYEMGWSKSDREQEGRRRILELATKNKIQYFAPCSTAWARVYREKPELALQHPQDSAHPGDVGHFLNLACFFAALTRESPVSRLPRTYPVWPHALAKPDNDADKAKEEALIAAFKPDAYQSRMPKWMRKNMSAATQYTLDDVTAKYLETVAWESWRDISQQLKGAE